MRLALEEDVTLQCLVGDIAAQPDIDIVVNAANAELMPGGGVAGAIHRAAGPELARACEPYAPIRPGQAVITDAFRLPNRFVIHCLGPIYGLDEPARELLAQCYANALELAEAKAVRAIAFPALSTGAFGYPLDQGAEVACRTVAEAAGRLEHVRLVRFVLFDHPAYEVFCTAAMRAAAAAGEKRKAN